MTKHITITGRVQHVFFRDFAVRNAEILGIDGWVRNLPDSSVEVLAEGNNLEKFIECLKRGPILSRVDKIEIKESKEKPKKGFYRID